MESGNRMFKKLKNTVIYYSVRALIGLIGFCPAFMVRFLGVFLGAGAFCIARSERALSIKHLKQSFKNISNRHSQIITRGVFNQLGISIVELCRIMRNPESAPAVSIDKDSLDILNETLALNKGAVFITGHIGNWELMAIELAKRGVSIYTVAKPSYDSRFTDFIKKKRVSLGVNPIYRDDKGTTAAMLRALKKGALLGFLIDQDTKVKSVFVDFFNRPAFTPSGAASFAIATKTPVLAGSIKRLSNMSHLITIEKITLPASELEATKELTLKLEQRIRGQVTQWVWFHRRWKTKQFKL